MSDVQPEAFDNEPEETQDFAGLPADDVGGDEAEAPDPEQQRRHDEAESRKIALKRERSARQRAESRADELAARLSRLEQGQQQGKPQADPFDKLREAKDPLSELEALRAIAETMASNQQEQDRSAQVQRQEQARVQALANTMQDYENDFRLEKPDYDKAADHFRTSLREELEAQGYEGRDLDMKLQSELLGLVSRATKADKDPAETVYKLAVKRGYGVDTGAKKLDTIKRGIAAGSSVGRVGSAPPRGPISVEAVARSDKKGAEFMKDFKALQKRMASQSGR